jgi:hypothetical protein
MTQRPVAHRGVKDDRLLRQNPYRMPGLDKEPAVLGAASYSVDELLSDTGHWPSTEQPESEPGLPCAQISHRHLVI